MISAPCTQQSLSSNSLKLRLIKLQIISYKENEKPQKKQQ